MPRIPHLELDHDGLRLTVRPVMPADRRLIEDGFSDLSERSRYLRFFSGSERLSPTKLRYLTNVDFKNHVALGILHESTPVAVGRWVRLADPGAADVALTVIDEYQGRGMGHILMELVAVSGRLREIDRLHFDVLAENQAMLRLLAHYPHIEDRGDDSVVQVEVAVDSIPVARIDDRQIGRMIDWAAAQAARRRSRKTA